ncbi:MAG TPA: hypothetical protein DCZ91_25455 [Lachnospiraceae bacterium]|nr:hypothetical protein [Lachnospiraceae bacterium]
MIKTTIKVIGGIARGTKKHTICYLAGMILLAIFPVCSVLLIKNMVNYVMELAQGGQPYIKFFFGVGLLFVAELLVQITKYSNSYREQRLKEELYCGFSDKLLEKYVSVEFSCFEEERSRNIIHHVGSAPQESLLEYFMTFFSLAGDFIEIFGYVIVFFSLSPLFGLLGTGCLGILLCLNFKRVDMMAKLYDEQTEDERKMLYLDKLLCTKTTLLDLKLNNAIDFVHHKRETLLRAIWKERLLRTLQSQFVYMFGDMSMVLWTGLVVFYVIYGITHGKLSYGVVVALLSAVQSIYGCSECLANDFASILKSGVNIRYLEEFMELPEGKKTEKVEKAEKTEKEVKAEKTEKEVKAEKTEKVGKAKKPGKVEKAKKLGKVEKAETAEKTENSGTMDGQGSLQFHHVSFRYPDAPKEVLRDVSFSIEPFQKVALVGENGSGKTTIVKLICGLYQPAQGRITLNDMDICRLPSEDAVKIYGAAFQDFSRYQFTVRHNVAIGSVERMGNDSEVFQAMEHAQASDLRKIIDKPLGMIEEDGINLSGGQWQKLALARAYFKKGQLLILDEPTASMDPKAESELYASFLKMMQSHTCIVVSHRLAIAKQCDQIIVLDKGQIVQKGSHDELLAEKGLYQEMFHAQSQWYREKDG